jgi:predicted kinase/uncharacterized HAD superfamily protein
MKLYYLKGLPGSGKSTWAKEYVLNPDNNAKRLNKDLLREMFDLSRWSKGNEKFVVDVERELAEKVLRSGHSLVVDNTGFAKEHEMFYTGLAAVLGADFEMKFFNTPLDECIQRDFNRPNPVGKEVIIRMYNQYLKQEKQRPTYTPPPDGIPAIIVDIDGTLAHMTGRSPYDNSRVHEDVVDEVVRDVVIRYFHDNFQVIIMSGRKDSCREETEAWLEDKKVPYHQLLMRKHEDDRKDSIVKREIFENEIQDKYNVHFVLDDRDQVVDMWRNELGLKVLQVSEGDF